MLLTSTTHMMLEKNWRGNEELDVANVTGGPTLKLTPGSEEIPIENL